MGGKRNVRAVLDTSVLLSAARGPLITLASNRAFKIVWSDFMERELRRKLVEIGWHPSNASALLGSIERLAESVDHTQILGATTMFG